MFRYIFTICNDASAVLPELAGFQVKRLFDVGVAGIHRLLRNQHVLHESQVAICVAGMDGALPGVVVSTAADYPDIFYHVNSDIFHLAHDLVTLGRSNVDSSYCSTNKCWIRCSVWWVSTAVDDAKCLFSWGWSGEYRQWIWGCCIGR